MASMRSQFREMRGGIEARRPPDDPAGAAAAIHSAFRSVKPDLPPGLHTETLEVAFRRALAAVASCSALLNCHSVRVDPVDAPPPRPARRPREFWVLCGLALVSFGGFVLALVGGGAVLSALVLLVVLLGAVGGAMWGLASGDTPPAVAVQPGARVTVDMSKADSAVDEALAGLDDAAKILVSRLSEPQGGADDDLPDDVLDLLHRLLSDNLTHRQVNRREDVVEVLRARGIEVVTACDGETDFRFNYRVAPDLSAATVARPALVRQDGALLRPGAALVPAG